MHTDSRHITSDTNKVQKFIRIYLKILCSRFQVEGRSSLCSPGYNFLCSTGCPSTWKPWASGYESWDYRCVFLPFIPEVLSMLFEPKETNPLQSWPHVCLFLLYAHVHFQIATPPPIQLIREKKALLLFFPPLHPDVRSSTSSTDSSLI